jgi:alpha-tubulin suppressor-like RCC1 family protein
VTQGGVRFTQLTSGEGQHTCGLDTEGLAWCWGANAEGQLGDGSQVNRSIPTAVAQGAVRFSRLAAGGGHTCGLTDTGTLYCWGGNNLGQVVPLGLPRYVTPIAVAGGPFASLPDRMMVEGSCAMDTSGTAVCWGPNQYGQTGVGSSGYEDAVYQVIAPTPVAGAPVFTETFGGFNASCGLTTAGEARCWGIESYHQFGRDVRFLTPVLAYRP